MNNDLIDLIDSYNKKGRIGDSSFVNCAAINLAKEYDLHNYLKDVKVFNKHTKFSETCYNPYRKELTVNLKEIKKVEPRIMLGKENYVHFYNLSLLYNLFHEFEHIKQEKNMDKRDKNLEDEILLLNNYIYMNPNFFNDFRSPLGVRIKGTYDLMKYNMFYKHNHDKAPIERLANINAHKEVSKVIDNIECEKYKPAILEFKLFGKELFLRQAKAGYKMKLTKSMTNSPSLDYLKRIKCVKDVLDEERILEEGQNLSFDQRLALGLPISRDEYRSLYDSTPYVLKKK